MSIITAIIPSARKPGRFELVVDEMPLVTISLDTIERLSLGVGHDIASTREAIEAEAAALAVYDRAVNMLAARARSAADLRRQLIRKGEPPALVDAAIERLTHAGFLDDAAFARAYTRHKALGPGSSRRRLQQELARKGVARETTDEAIADVFEEEAIDEAAILDQLVRKRLRSLASLDGQTRNRRLWSFLARRGYDSEAIRKAIERATGDDVEER
jgi:regulatory protein